jgi:hypothetical protein
MTLYPKDLSMFENMGKIKIRSVLSKIRRIMFLQLCSIEKLLFLSSLFILLLLYLGCKQTKTLNSKDQK